MPVAARWKSHRLLAAFDARSLGYGGISRVSEATGVARSTIGRGLKDLDMTMGEDDLRNRMDNGSGNLARLIDEGQSLYMES